MAQETMTCRERLDAALAFEKPDRVPIVPLYVKSTALNYCGVGQAAGARDHELALNCMLKMYDDVGGWDGMYIDAPDTDLFQLFVWQLPMRFLIPGIDLPDDAVLQVQEAEVMTVDDYDQLIEEGWQKFYYGTLINRLVNWESAGFANVTEALAWFQDFQQNRCRPEWSKRGVNQVWGDAGGVHPFFKLSLCRSLTRFIEDLYFRKELVDRAMRRMADEWIQDSLAEVKAHPSNSLFIAEERASAFYIPLSVFERFWWPYTAEFVDAHWAEHVVTVMHIDNDWGKNLPYFKRDLPRGSYMLQPDSTTDIFAAKELLKGHALFHGDLPAAVQAIGSPEDVAAYCKRLIDEVGYEGGFILGTGCETAMDFGFENMRAMIDTGKTYELSKPGRASQKPVATA